MEEKLVELETKFSFQEDLLADLNDIVIKQQRQLDELLRELTVIKEQLQEAEERDAGQGEREQDERPPHY